MLLMLFRLRKCLPQAWDAVGHGHGAKATAPAATGSQRYLSLVNEHRSAQGLRLVQVHNAVTFYTHQGAGRSVFPPLAPTASIHRCALSLPAPAIIHASKPFVCWPCCLVCKLLCSDRRTRLQ